MAGRFDFSVPQGLQKHTARLRSVGAVRKAAAAAVGRKVRKQGLQLLLGDARRLLRLEGGKARGIRDIGLIAQIEKRNVAGRVPAAAELGGDLSGLDGSVRAKSLQNGAFPDAGISGVVSLPRYDSGKDGRANPQRLL